MTAVYQLAAAYHDQAGNFMQNVWHYQLNEAGTFTPFEYSQRLISAWQATTQPDFLALLGNDVLLDFLSSKKVTAGGGPSSTVIVNAIGTGGGTSVTSGLAADIGWQTAAASHRAGHTFIGACPDGAISAGVWQVGYGNLVLAFITDMQQQLVLAGGAGTADFGMLTRKTGQFNRATFGELKPKPTMLNKRTLPVI